MPTTIIIGAGWAGLSCAFYLAQAGHHVQVLEAAPQIGGRARGIKFNDRIIDNGQHIGLGAYHNLRNLLRALNVDEKQLFKIMPLEILAYGQKKLHLQLPNLTPPFNLLIGIIKARNLSWCNRMQLLRFAAKVQQQNFTLAQDCSVLELLQNYHQSSDVIEQIWEPIALAAMSTDIQQASAQVFLNVLRHAFTQDASNSHWYLPAHDLSTILPTHIAQYLLAHGNKIFCDQRVTKITIAPDQTVQIFSINNTWQADHIVLATPPWQTSNLLQTHPLMQTICADLSKFSYEPITTIYFQFPKTINLPYPIVGMINAACHWIFDRAFAAQPDMLSAVVSGPLAINFSDKERFKQSVLADIQRHFPHIPQPVQSKIICEKRAAFTCNVAIQKQRPLAKTTVKNLWLCGDYLQTGLPATLEGAVVSGKLTADSILEKY